MFKVHTRTRIISTMTLTSALLVFLATKTGAAVGEIDVQLSSTFDDSFALEGGHIVCHLSAVFPVVHHQQFKVFHVVNHNLVKAVGQGVSSLLVGTISNVGHDNTASLELSTDTGINALGSAPAFLQHTIHTKYKMMSITVSGGGGGKTSICCDIFLSGSDAYLDGDLAIALMALEGVGALLNALHLHQWLHHLCPAKKQRNKRNQTLVYSQYPTPVLPPYF